MTTATKEPTYAKQTLEAIPKILKATSMARLLDQGLEAGEEGFIGFNELVNDEAFQEKMKQYESLDQNVRKLIASLPQVVRGEIKKSLDDMGTTAMMNHYEGAEKMADILIRFYLRHHLGLDV
jgi:hypothetical protein